MFRKFALGMAVTLGFAASARADVVPFDPTGTGNAGGAVQVSFFDPTPGNAGQLGTLPFGGAGGSATGPTLFQANMSALLDGSSLPIVANGGLGTSYQLITRAVFPETTTVAGNTASFSLAAGTPNTFEIAIVPAGSAGNNATGANFAGGIVILRGTVTSVSGDFTANTSNVVPIDPGDARTTITGNGSQTFNIDVDFFDRNYFPVASNQTLSQVIFTSQTSLPFTTVQALNSGAPFWTGQVPNAFGGVGINGLGGPDILLFTDGSYSITLAQIPGETPVPEPATLAVFAGVMGVGGMVYRRRKAAKA